MSSWVVIAGKMALKAGANLIGKVKIRNPADTADLGDNTNPLVVRVTDTTNYMPTGDAAARALFQKITDGTNTAGVTPNGQLRCADEPTPLFNEAFDGAAFDTTDRWYTEVQTGSGFVLLFVGEAAISCVASNSTAALSSRPLFRPASGFGYMSASFQVQPNATLGTNAHLFWGFGEVDGAWSLAAPLKTGCGFEVTSGGVMRAVAYGGSSVTFSSNVTAPTDGGLHKFDVVWGADAIWWYLDGVQVATVTRNSAGFPAFSFFSEVTHLPVRIHAITGGSAPSGSASFAVNSISVGDSSRSSLALSDSEFPWRRGRIASNGSIFAREGDAIAYLVRAQAVATANNKSMLSIFNTGTTYRLRVREIYLINVQTSAVTGVQCRFAARRLTGSTPSGGTGITAVPMNTKNPTASSHMDLRTGATVGTEDSTAMNSLIWNTEEHVTASIKDVTHERLMQMSIPLIGRARGQELELGPGEGVTVKCETSTTTGSFDLVAVVGFEPVS